MSQFPVIANDWIMGRAREREQQQHKERESPASLMSEETATDATSILRRRHWSGIDDVGNIKSCRYFIKVVFCQRCLDIMIFI